MTPATETRRPRHATVARLPLQPPRGGAGTASPAPPLLAWRLLVALCLLACSASGVAQVPFDTATRVAAGRSHSCALTSAGAVLCWGSNSEGQLGDGSTTSRPFAVAVSGLDSGVAAIAAGDFHTCALTDGGGVKCWGRNGAGHLGDNSTSQRLAPVDVVGLGSGVQAIAAGGNHTCAITQAGALLCWGFNGDGQLGDGSNSDRLVPTPVSGLASGVSAVAVGGFHTCAVANGATFCWGFNANGQLGDNSQVPRSTPVAVVGLGSGSVAVAAGERHSCALSSGGGTRCWGSSASGQLGGGSLGTSLTPVNVAGLTSGVARISADNATTCAVTTAGAAKCWGTNGSGQLGDGTQRASAVPVDVSGLGSGVAAIEVGWQHVCAVVGVAVKCWGENRSGQLGVDTASQRTTAVDVSGFPFGLAAIAAGASHSCALTTAGGVKCWGSNTDGQLGDGTFIPRLQPVDASGLGSGISAIAAGFNHSCAVTSTGAMRCWGDNGAGQLGDDTQLDRATAITPVGLGSGVTAIAAGSAHSCAVAGGGVKCWGASDFGQLGYGGSEARFVPTAVSGLEAGVTALAAGTIHTCALTAAGAVRCWGNNAAGQLGDGSTTDRSLPVEVQGLGSGVVGIAAGEFHTCALTSAGGVKCWGDNTRLQLGNGGGASQAAPIDVNGLGSGVLGIAAGSYHSCARLNTGLRCWGLNTNGQVGDGTMFARSVPTTVSAIGATTSLDGGGFHTCAVTSTGAGKCWGFGSLGQLGDGVTTGFSATPRDALRATVPAAPGIGLASPGNRSATVAFTPPPSQGGRPILRYLATSTPGGLSGQCTASPCIVEGLSNGTPYTFTVAAINQVGVGPPSAASNSVTPGADNSPPTQLAAGVAHSCALTSEGNVKCWGSNRFGQLGDNTRFDRAQAVQVAGLGGPVTAIAAGYFHTCALTSSGGVRCWGRNLNGELGDNSLFDRVAPVGVAGLASGVVAIAAGGSHTCALLASGGVKCWGNNNGALGDNTTFARNAPVDVVGLASGVTAISLGFQHSCALTAAGAVKCWGNNGSGQLGDNSTSTRLAPVDVSGLASGVRAIAAGGNHSCAATVAGGATCWGANFSGQLGDGSTQGRLTPVAVSGLLAVDAIASGFNFTCALSAGSVRCWGQNASGELGDNTLTARSSPVAVSGLQGGVTAIATGSAHACALSVGGAVRCWGSNNGGQLGHEGPFRRSSAVTVSGLAAGAGRIAAGFEHSCAATASGARCWGSNSSGQIGDGTGSDRLAPVAVLGISTATTRIAAGQSHSCAVLTGGGVKCWGANNFGQLGDNTTASARFSAVDVSGLGSGVTEIAAGSTHTCALTSAGAVKCWGRNAVGQLGDNSTTLRRAPVDVLGLASGVVAITAGDAHTCALTSAGGVKCWGANGFGELGDNTQSIRQTPVDVLGLGSGVVAIAAGANHTCALTAGGAVKCWGLNSSGQIGDGTTTTRFTAVDVPGAETGVTAIAAGGGHTCAITGAGGALCWGANGDGQLGDGTTVQQLLPVAVSGRASGLAAIAAGGGHSCALTNAGAAVCWGGGGNGQIGDGVTVGYQLAPVEAQLTIGGVRVFADGFEAEG